MKLSIVIPAHNEGKRILPVLKNYYAFFTKELGKNFELIIIPNNCSDNTSSIVEEFCTKKKNANFIEIKKYSGKGGAIRKGFEKARGDLIGFVDADKSTSPEEFFKLYKNIEGFEGVIASRKIEGARVIPKRTFYKNLSSNLFGFFVRILFNMKYQDTQCGAKLFKKKTAKYLAKNSSIVGWIFDVDFLYLAKKKNYRVKEIPIRWVDDDGSHVTFIDGIKSILELFKYRLFLKNPKH